MPSIDDKNETEDEDMEQETPESEKSDDDVDSDTGSGSDEDEHSGEWCRQPGLGYDDGYRRSPQFSPTRIE